VTVAEPPAVYPSSPTPPASAQDEPQAPAAEDAPPVTPPAAPATPAAAPSADSGTEGEPSSAAAGVRALQEAFAIDVAEREDRHRAEVRAMQQSFMTDVAAREDRHRAEIQALHQRFTADITTQQERHRSEVQALQQAVEEAKTQWNDAKAATHRESEARANAEAEAERLKLELDTDRSEISRLNSRNGELTSNLAAAQEQIERLTAQTRRLDAELSVAIADAEKAAAEAERQINDTTRKLEDTTRRLDDTTRRLEATEEKAGRYAEQSAAHEAAGLQLRQTITEQRAERERMTEERDAARQRTAELEAQLRSQELDAEQAADEAARQLQEALRRIDEAEEHTARATGQASVHEATVEELRKAMAEQQAELRKVTYDRDAARRRIAQLEEELDASHLDVPVRRVEEPAGDATAPAPTRRKSDLSPESVAAAAAALERPLSLAEDIELVDWQREALAAWAMSGHRGVVEAVTGAGKTDLAHWAIAEALDAEKKVLVIAPTAERVDHWYDSLRAALPINRVGKRTGLLKEQLGSYDVVVSSAIDAARERISGETFEGLIVADQVHVYGTRDLSLALDPRYSWRLGLTAAYEREDDGIATYVDPYFGGVTFSLGYDRALADEVVSRFDIALVSVPLTGAEREEYDNLGQQIEELAAALRTNFGARGTGEDFDDAVAALAADRGPARPMARNYQKATARRDEIVARASDKAPVIKAIAKRVRDAEKALVFAQTQDAASHVAKLFGTEGCATRTLSGMQERRLLARRAGESRDTDEDIVLLAGPRGMAEVGGVAGVDLGVIVGASRNRLQLIQRLGRLTGPKLDDRHARVVVLYAEGTAEDSFGEGTPFATTLEPHASRLERFSAVQAGALGEFLTPGAAPDAAE
jgi:superfamily II DNA or RNA helicase